MRWYENLIVTVIVRDHSSESSSSAWVGNCGQGQRGPSFTRTQKKGIPLQELIQRYLFCPKHGVLSPQAAQIEKHSHTEAEIESICPEGETEAAILAHWQTSLQIQIEEKNYKINNCQHSFLYDLKLAARLFSLNM